MRLALVWLCATTLIMTLATAPAPAALMAGAAKAKITPEGPVWLSGYAANRQSIGVHDDLWARALVLRRGDQWLALAAVDLLGFPNLYVRRVRELVSAVPDEAVIVAATHVHSGPDVIGLWGPTPGQSGVDPAYVERVIATVAQVIEQAAANLAPAGVRYASGQLSGASKNIRVGALLDTELAALQAVGADGEVIATLVNFANHPEIMNNQYVTADFPHWLYQRLEGAVGGVALFVNSALGGMVTPEIEDADSKGRDNWHDAERVGNLTADRALELLADAPPAADAPLALRSAPLLVPLENARFRAAIEAGVLPDFRENGMVRTEIAAGTIGGAQFVTMPGEVFPNIGFLLKRWMSGDVKFLFGLAQDELGYIMSREDWGLRLYQYETSMSVGPDMGYLMVEGLRDLIAQVNPAPAAAPFAVGAVDEWFMSLPARFNAQAAGELRATYLFDLTGEGGGRYVVRVAEGQAAVERGSVDQPDLKVTISTADMAALLAGELDAMTAFMTGKLLIDGDIGLALRMGDLFAM